LASVPALAAVAASKVVASNGAIPVAVARIVVSTDGVGSANARSIDEPPNAIAAMSIVVHATLVVLVKLLYTYLSCVLVFWNIYFCFVLFLYIFCFTLFYCPYLGAVKVVDWGSFCL
jgi:hypothetical protein